MIPLTLSSAWLLLSANSVAAQDPLVADTTHNITYQGLNQNGIEVFLGIPYGQDTSGANRFKPPQPVVPEPGTVIDARSVGPACPQPLGQGLPPLTLTNTTHISEDCLHLNVARPRGIAAEDPPLPVLVWIYGGGFFTGISNELTTAPDGMILESVENGLPVIHVAMNYRLGVFGFAQSDALRSEGSENAALRDQRLAIEWVRDNIAHFGGDPNKITIFGQSSGGVSVGLQIMAYGGTKPVPFQRGISESQVLEPGITGNFSIDAFQRVVEHVGCNTTALHSPETVACLRNLDMETLQAAAEATYLDDLAHNIGDIWLPTVDGDFLPAAPSTLLAEQRFARNVSMMLGWCEDDLTFFTDASIASAEDTASFVSSYAWGLSPSNLATLLSLYPSSDFTGNPSANLSAEFYRTARIFRDLVMTCEPILYASALASANVYLYTWNQTILDPILASLYNQSGQGVIHTSEFAYIFGNLSHWDTNGYPFAPTPADYSLVRRGARSWTTFASLGAPGLEGHDTFQGFTPAFSGGDGEEKETFSIFVAGGPHEGLSPVEGPGSAPAVAAQKLRERCAFINSEEVVRQLQF